jgi:ABC-type nitrate/sulfonate/bicarbonate transport system substrate-binding protein
MRNKFILAGTILFSLAFIGLLYWFYSSRLQSQLLYPVTVRLKWLHQAQFAGNYVADQKGYYKNAGLEVTLKPYDYQIDPIDDVLSGAADFGITGAENLLVARSQGKKIQALAVIYQESPAVAYSLKSSGINSLSGFIGKKIGVSKDLEPIIFAMLEHQGINHEQDVQIVPIDFGAKSVLNGEVDIGTGYITNETIQAENAGQPVNVFAPYKYGIKVYADVLFTTQDFIENNPQIVDAFVKATLSGWEYALNNIDEAVNLSLLYKDPNNTAQNFQHQKKLLQSSLPFIRPSSGRFIGDMNYVDWQKTYQLMLNSGLISEELDITQAYTDKFITP